MAGWTTGLGYMVVTLFYQAATFARHPGLSLVWIGMLSAIFLVACVGLRRRGLRERQRLYVAVADNA